MLAPETQRLPMLMKTCHLTKSKNSRTNTELQMKRMLAPKKMLAPETQRLPMLMKTCHLTKSKNSRTNTELQMKRMLAPKKMLAPEAPSQSLRPKSPYWMSWLRNSKMRSGTP